MKFPNLLDERFTRWSLAIYCVCAAIILLIGICSAHAGQDTVFRDNRGRVIGRSNTDSGGQTRFWDARGNSLGTATRSNKR
jgi:hypothetical protein